LAASGVKSPGNWKEPKSAHKKLMNALLQCRATIIFCLRADEKIEILRENNKTVIKPLVWMPICEKRFLYEMTASFTLTPDRPGIPHFDLPHKLQQQHRSMFSDQKPIGEDSGLALAEWARGDAPAPTIAQFKPTEELAPTAADYFLQWEARILNATRAEHIGPVWNTDKQLHKLIAWTSAHSYEDLKAKVLKAVNAMKAPAH